MGYTKLISLVCDGPCGTVLEGVSRVPEGWMRVQFEGRGGYGVPGKPSGATSKSYLCPSCQVRLDQLLKTNGFSRSRSVSDSEEVQ